MCSCDSGVLNLVCRKAQPTVASTDPEVITAASTSVLAGAALLLAALIATL
jgi:hypothetical protein